MRKDKHVARGNMMGELDKDAEWWLHCSCVHWQLQFAMTAVFVVIIFIQSENYNFKQYLQNSENSELTLLH